MRHIGKEDATVQTVGDAICHVVDVIILDWNVSCLISFLTNQLETEIVQPIDVEDVIYHSVDKPRNHGRVGDADQHYRLLLLRLANITERKYVGHSIQRFRKWKSVL